MTTEVKTDLQLMEERLMTHITDLKELIKGMRFVTNYDNSSRGQVLKSGKKRKNARDLTKLKLSNSNWKSRTMLYVCC